MSLQTRNTEELIYYFFNREPQIELIGVSPEEANNELTEHIVDRLGAEAPSDARLKFTLEKEDNVYFGSCKITSSSLSLLVKAHAYAPLQTMQLLEKKAKTQLDLWKRKRTFG